MTLQEICLEGCAVAIGMCTHPGSGTAIGVLLPRVSSSAECRQGNVGEVWDASLAVAQRLTRAVLQQVWSPDTSARQLQDTNLHVCIFAEIMGSLREAVYGIFEHLEIPKSKNDRTWATHTPG